MMMYTYMEKPALVLLMKHCFLLSQSSGHYRCNTCRSTWGSSRAIGKCSCFIFLNRVLLVLLNIILSSYYHLQQMSDKNVMYVLLRENLMSSQNLSGLRCTSRATREE